jgi:hypothetical protein
MPPLALFCLQLPVVQGTMTFAEQNTEAEAWEQLDYALSQGVNFIDTGALSVLLPTVVHLRHSSQHPYNPTDCNRCCAPT